MTPKKLSTFEVLTSYKDFNGDKHRTRRVILAGNKSMADTMEYLRVRHKHPALMPNLTVKIQSIKQIPGEIWEVFLYGDLCAVVNSPRKTSESVYQIMTKKYLWNPDIVIKPEGMVA